MLNSVMLNYLHVEFKYVEKCAGRTPCAGRTKPLDLKYHLVPLDENYHDDYLGKKYKYMHVIL